MPMVKGQCLPGVPNRIVLRPLRCNTSDGTDSTSMWSSRGGHSFDSPVLDLRCWAGDEVVHDTDVWYQAALRRLNAII